ncbi:MAG TPA: riboflavin synthase [Flavobacterium sp.]|nr:riboflavin synthase [Flavobacterium sp.]
MFTGIIETLGVVSEIKEDNENLHITIKSHLSSDLKIDQSVAHNGICLTVVSLGENTYTVTAINETIKKTNIGNWQRNDIVNLERAMKIGSRLDGHIVQGHVDQTAVCTKIEEAGGSTIFVFEYSLIPDHVGLIVEKGSITINGVSLTVVDAKPNSFSVAIIPYTFENTNFKELRKGSVVNLEFDVIGKYVAKLLNQRL